MAGNISLKITPRIIAAIPATTNSLSFTDFNLSLKLVILKSIIKYL